MNKVSSSSASLVLDQLESLKSLSEDQKASTEIKIKNTWTGGKEVAVTPMKGMSSFYGSFKAMIMPGYVAAAKTRALEQFKQEILGKYGESKTETFKVQLGAKFDEAFKGQKSLLAGTALKFIDDISTIKDTTANKAADLSSMAGSVATDAKGKAVSMGNQLFNWASKQVTGKSVNVENQLKQEGPQALNKAMAEIDNALNKINKDAGNNTSQIRKGVFEIARQQMSPLAKQIVDDMIEQDKFISTSLEARQPIDVKNATGKAKMNLLARGYKL